MRLLFMLRITYHLFETDRSPTLQNELGRLTCQNAASNIAAKIFAHVEVRVHLVTDAVRQSVNTTKNERST